MKLFLCCLYLLHCVCVSARGGGPGGTLVGSEDPQNRRRRRAQQRRNIFDHVDVCKDDNDVEIDGGKAKNCLQLKYKVKDKDRPDICNTNGIKNICRETCGECSDGCEDEQDTKFQLKDKDKKCKDLAKLKKEEREAVCAKGMPAYNICKDTCHNEECHGATADDEGTPNNETPDPVPGPEPPDPVPGPELPNIGQDDVCADDNDSEIDGGKAKNCLQLKYKVKDKERQKICVTNGIKDICRETCGVCADPCEDEEDTKFKLKGEDKKCKDLAKLKKEEREAECAKGMPAYGICKDTCLHEDCHTPAILDNIQRPEETGAPSEIPSAGPTSEPTPSPTPGLTSAPTPGPTLVDTPGPTPPATPAPTLATLTGSLSPTPGPTDGPTLGPTLGPTPETTPAPTTASQTPGPTLSPSVSNMPSNQPSLDPTGSPSSGPTEQSSTSPRPSASPTITPLCPTTIYTDVAIVGAGAAGVAAAARLQAVDPTLDVKILESTNRIGGRVRSKQFGGYTVEEGANWIWPDKTNPVFEFAKQYGVDYTTNDWYDWVVYDAITGQEVDPWNVVDELDSAWVSAEADVAAWRQKGSPPTDDLGMVQLLADNGYVVQNINTPEENLKYAMEWTYTDWSMAKEDVSIHSIPYVDADQLVIDQAGGFEKVIQQYHANNVSPDALMTNMRVLQIEYDLAVTQNGKTYKSRVVAGPEGSCTEVYSLRTILTVSTGVINSDMIAFSPALKYDHTTHSPFEMAQFIKVFYQFPTAFWDDTEFLVAVRDLPNRGKCQQWMNLNHKDFIKGSNILVCFMMTEAYESVAGSTANSLSATMLDSLLDPLRVKYGNNFVTPTSTDYARVNEDVDFGNGAYSYWKIGATLENYAKFFGGFPTLTSPCDHNGCNTNNEWILHMSGTCSCLEQWEHVHAAWVGGERSANYILDSLGYAVDTSSDFCNGGL